MHSAIIKNLLALKLRGARHVTHPVLASLYVTHKCNLRCTYCSDGCGSPFYLNKETELSLKDICAVLGKIAKTVRYLDITGGEPLLREDIIDIVSCARRCGFKGIYLNTNGLLLDKYPRLIEMVDTLTISLDSLNPFKLMEIYRTDENSVTNILNNIRQVLKSRHKGKLYISSVIMPDNIGHINEIVEFCEIYGTGFTASPQLVGVSAKEGLHNNPEYKALIDKIIEFKKKGMRVMGPIEYYKTIRDFSPYKCLPMLHTAVSPSGMLYMPCLELGEKMVNLLEYDSLHEAINSSVRNIKYPPECGNVCHILCHAGLSLLCKNLSVPLSELFYELRGNNLIKEPENEHS